MSQQSTLNNFFKSKASPPPVPAQTNKRHILCLAKSPRSIKVPKNHQDTATGHENTKDVENEPVTVSSDSESDFCTPKKIFTPQKPSSNKKIFGQSPETVMITCDVSPSIFITQVPEDSPSCTIQVTQRPKIFVRKDLNKEFNSCGTSSLKVDPSTPRTPSKTPITPQSNKSSGKYFSPTKKRVMTKKSPAKRNLTRDFNGNNGRSSLGLEEEGDFPNACDSQDLKTKFFLTMIDEYLRDERLKCLLEDSSQMLLMACMTTPKPGMKLVCRLYWRQPAWHQTTKLLEICTKEYKQKNTIITPLISETMQETIAFLVANRLIESSAVAGENTEGLSFDDCAKILTRPQLLDICKDLKLKIQSKQDAVQALKVYSQRSSIAKFFVTKSNLGDNRTRVLKMMRAKAGACYKLSELARLTLDKLYMLMYLGANYTLIREKQLEHMLIQDYMNQETYPVPKDMQIDNASVVFQNKEQFDRYFIAHNMYEDFLAADDASKKTAIIKDAFKQYKDTGDEEMLRCKALPTWLRKFTPANIYVKILDSGVQELKKEKTEAGYELAVDILRTLTAQTLFQQHKIPEWHDEMALIMAKYLDRCEEAAEVLIEGLRSELSDEAKDCMRPRALKLAKQQNIRLGGELRAALRAHAARDAVLESSYTAIHIYKHPVDNYNQKGKQRFEARTEDGRSTLSAEEYCIMHLINEGQYTHGEHWEGRIVTTIFALLFWDIIYMSPAGAAGTFLSRFQRRPLDMSTDCFYENRRALLDDRLLFIQDSSDHTLVDIMRSRWDERPENEISDIQRSIGWDNIRMVVLCLGARGVAAVCRRLLAQYGRARAGFPDLTMWNVNTNKICFIEVKTDADKPSIKQLQWMEHLRASGIDAAFCYVGANTTRKRARASDLSLSPD